METGKKILIGMPCAAGQVPTPMVRSLLQLRKPLPCAFLVVDRQRTDKARNHFVMETLKGGFDYLFMVDDDNPIPPDTLEKLLEDDKDIVIAPILSRNPNPNTGIHDLCAFYSEEKMIEKDEFEPAPLRIYENIKHFRDNGYLHRIDAGGTGAMLIKRHVLETLHKKYLDYVFEYGDITVNGQRRTMSEDAEFCERAVDAGFSVWLDDRVRPLHLGNLKAVQYSDHEQAK